MDIPRNQWQVRHRLDRLELTLRFPETGPTSLQAIGRGETTQRSLWTYREEWGAAQGDLPPHDALAHLALVCLQDRPNNIDRLELALRGGSLWEDQELPW